MIIKKYWIKTATYSKFANAEHSKQGWFLFGIIPLYVRDMTPRYRK